MCIISVNQWGNTGFPAMLLWVCLWLEMFLYACVCVCAFASVLTSCPEACDPDVRLWALRTRQEHIVSRDRPARFSPVDIQTHVVSIPVFSIFFFARYTLWYLSRELRVVHYGAKKKKRKESARGVCVCDRGRLRVRFVYISSLFVHIWPETQKHPVFSRLWDECAGDHTENNCGNCNFFS